MADVRAQTMKKRALSFAVSGCLLATGAFAVQAEEQNQWTVQFGLAHVHSLASADFKFAGTPAPGAAIDVQNNNTLAAEISYAFTPALSAGLTVGLPVRARVKGKGDAAPFGVLGAVRYGPLALTARYTFDTGSRWHPYIGAGLGYYTVLKEHDGFIKDVKVDNGLGTVFQAGVQYDMDSRSGVFFDVKKLFVKTTVTGNCPDLGGAPVTADVRFNPVAVHAGVFYRF
jgi:outer membrane protein